MKTHAAPFAQSPRATVVAATTAFTLTGANSLLDDNPTNTVKLVTAGADGAIVTGVKAIARATNTATMGALFLRKAGDAAGIRRLIGSVTISAQTINTTTKVTEYPFDIASDDKPLRLDAGDELYVGVAVTQANGINFVGLSVDF